MLKAFAVILGVLFLLGGVLGFIPDTSPEGKLFGYFLTNWVLNLIYIVTGIIFIWVGTASARASKFFFQIFGVIYAILTILGFFHLHEPIFTVIANNFADVWLHLLMAVILLWIGFGLKVSTKKSSP